MDEYASQVRYHLLETVRQYARERLDEAAETAWVRDRHMDWYAGLAEQAEVALRGAERGAWLARLEQEHSNLRAALGWSTREGGNPRVATRLAGLLWRFWLQHAHLREAHSTLEQTGAPDGAMPPMVRAIALHGAGVVARERGEYDRAVALYEESLALRRELGDRRGIAEALEGLALVAADRAEPERAALLLGAAEAVGEATGASPQPTDLAAHDQTIASIRRVLGEAGFAAAYSRGRALTLDQILIQLSAPSPP
jgi:non-specific serine/threonine protein kinase